MVTDFVKIVGNVRNLAERNKLTNTKNLADSLLKKSTQPLNVLVTSGQVQLDGFIKWLQENNLASSLRIIASEDTDIASTLLLATKVTMVFQCGQFVESKDNHLLATAVFMRPKVSYAIVLVGAEHITDKNDMAMVQRIAWGALAMDSSLDQNRNNLREQRIFLWGNIVPSINDDTQIEIDKNELLTWFSLPIELTDAGLKHYQLCYLVDNALAEAEQTESLQLPQSTQTQTEQIKTVAIYRETKNILQTLNKRLQNRIDTNRQVTERALAASLQSFGNKLIQGLPDYINHLHQSQTLANDFGQHLTKYVLERLGEWRHDATLRLEQYAIDIKAVSEMLLEDVNWLLINTLAKQHGESDNYPQQLLDTLMNPFDFLSNVPHIQAKDSMQSDPKPRLVFSSASFIDTLILITITAGTSAGVVFAFTHDIVPTMVSAFVGVAGALGFKQLQGLQVSGERSGIIQIRTEEGILMINEWLRSVQNQLSHTIEDSAKQLQFNINNATDKFDFWLSDGIAAAEFTTKPLAGIYQDIETLRQYRIDLVNNVI